MLARSLPLRRRLARALAAAWLVAAAPGLLVACAPAIDAQLDEAQSLVAEGRPMAALPLLESVVRRRPEDGPANLLLGQVLIQIGRTQNAFGPLQRALDVERWAIPAGLLLASAHLGEGRPQRALETVNQVLESHPNQTAALRIRATAQLQLGHAEAALDDAQRILELDPSDPQAPVLAGTALSHLGRLDEAEATLVALEREAREANDAARHAPACAALAAFLESIRRDDERADALWQDCLAMHPTDPTLLQGATAAFDQRGDPDAAIAALERALAIRPTAPGIRLALAQRLAAQGRGDEGDRLLLEAAPEPGGGPDVQAMAAWQAVASYRLRRGDLAGASDALANSVAHAPPGQADGLRLQRGLLLLDLGRDEEAAAVRAEISIEAFAELLEGRALLAAGRIAEARQHLGRASELAPTMAEPHYWLGVAAQSEGRVDRAFHEWDRALELGPASTDAAFAAARLSAALGEHARALELLRRHRSMRGTYPGRTRLLEARMLAALGQATAAANVLEEQLRRGGDAETWALLLRVIANLRGPEAALERLDEARDAGLDVTAPSLRPVLQVYVEQAAAAGRIEAALAELERARAAHGQDTDLLVLEATLLAAAGDPEAATERLRTAAERAPDDPRALANLATWLLNEGQPEAALAPVRRARELAPEQADVAYLASQIHTRLGDDAAAERALRDAVAAAPLHAGACNDLAWRLASGGRDLDQALQLARRAVRVRGDAQMLDTLGFVLLARGEAEEAAQVLADAVARAPENPGFRYRLGLALARTGREDEARRAFEAALERAPFPEADRARAELARLGR